MAKRVDPSRTLASFDRAERNIRFGIARGLTQTAKDAAADFKASLPRRLDRPTPFTQNAAGITAAKRDYLTAWIFIRAIQAGYLRLEETGGVRTPKPGQPLTIPKEQRVNIYGNIPRGALARLRSDPNLFVSRGGAGHLPPGIYLRTKKGRGKARRAALKFLVRLVKQTRYKPRLGFRTTVEATVRRVVKRNIEAGIAEAIRTAK